MNEGSKLFSSGTIGNLEIRNRIIMPAMEPGLADENGFLDAFAASAYYGLRAKGGVGLIISGNVAVVAEGRAAALQAGLWRDDQLEAFKELSQVIHQEGAKFFVQLSHAGREVHPLLGWEAVAPIAIPSVALRTKPRELSREEIEELVNAFARAAQRAIEAGADGVEIHGAHGYLICQFLSPNMNHRQDEYGLNPAGRARFALEIIEAIRERCSKDLPLSFRLSADEMIADGIDPELACEYAGLFEEAGVDLLNVSACNYESAFFNLPNYYLEEGCFIPLAETIRSEIEIPVAAVGRIRKRSMAEQAIESGSTDFVAIGRPLIADPYLPAKFKRERDEEVRPCLSCNKCLDSIGMGSLACTINPKLQGESWPRQKAPASSSGVLVVGSGPAGLSAAAELAWSGWSVKVIERKKIAGGKLNLALLPPRKKAVEEYRDWLLGEAQRAGVRIECNSTWLPSNGDEEEADYVILASGAIPDKAPFQVDEGCEMVSVSRAFEEPERLGNEVLIIGGGAEGAELADFLSEGGKQVTLLEKRRKVALDLLPNLRFFLLRRLEEKGVRVIPKFTVTRAGSGYVEGKRGKKSKDRLEGFSSTVRATGLRSPASFADGRKTREGFFLSIGDASTPGSILEAVRDGAEAASSLKQKRSGKNS